MIKGVNLGGWLVLEKWMSPELFAELDAEDEKDFYEQLSWEEVTARLMHHRDTFITEEDFAKIAETGCTLLRLPVPYSLFGDVHDRLGC